MEFKHNSVIALYLSGKPKSAIVRELRHLKVNKMFVYRTIKRYNDTGSIAKRYGGGRKKTATSSEMVRKVKARLERNPRRSGNQMAKELKISQRSIRRIFQNELKVKPYKLKINMAQVAAADFQKNFRIVVEKIFNNWQNLRLAGEHGMGGRNGQQVAIQIMDYTYQYCIGNENITQGELQEKIKELMAQEFNTLCDDNSIPEICRSLLRHKQLALHGQYALIEQELSKLPQGKDWLRPDVKITYTPNAGHSLSDDGDLDDDKNHGAMEADSDKKEEKPTSSRVTRSQARKKKRIICRLGLK